MKRFILKAGCIIIIGMALCGTAYSRSLAISARAFYNAMYSESLGEVLDLQIVNSAYGAELDLDVFLRPRFSLAGMLTRTYLGRYQQFYVSYGAALRFWKRNHYWSLGAQYYNRDSGLLINTAAPANLLLGQIALGLFGGEGINWTFSFPVQAGMELNSRVFYGDIGIQAGLMFSL